MLTFVQERGNTTFYEWRTGKVPDVVERPTVEEETPEAVTEDSVSFTVSLMLQIILQYGVSVLQFL